MLSQQQQTLNYMTTCRIGLNSIRFRIRGFANAWPQSILTYSKSIHQWRLYLTMSLHTFHCFCVTAIENEKRPTMTIAMSNITNVSARANCFQRADAYVCYVKIVDSQTKMCLAPPQCAHGTHWSYGNVSFHPKLSAHATTKRTAKNAKPRWLLFASSATKDLVCTNFSL